MMSGLKKRIIQYGGLATGVVLIAVLFSRNDIVEIFRHAVSIGPNFMYVVGVAFLAQSIAVIAWYLSFLEIPRLFSLVHLYFIRLIGESLSQINPTSLVAGETLKAVLLKNRMGVRYLNGAMSIFLSRIMIFLGTGFLLVLTVGFMFQFMDSLLFKSISIIICLMVIGAFIFIFHSLGYGHGVFFGIAALIDRYLGKFSAMQTIAEYLREVDKDMVEFYSRRRVSFYCVFILSVLHQLVGALEYYVIFQILGIDVGFLSCVLFDVGSMMIRSAGFFIPGQLGLEELGNKLMFSVTNIPGDDTWLTVSLIRRGRQFFWILTGFAVYLVISRKEEIAR